MRVRNLFSLHPRISIATGFVLVVGVMLIVFLTVIGTYHPQKDRQPTAGTRQLPHFTGGFNIGSDAEITNAVADGIQVVLDYGYNPTGADSRSVALRASHLTISDQMPEEYLRKFGNGSITLTTLETDVANHLNRVQNNSMIIAYWVLDDWTYGDGTAKQALIHINTLIHRYTPGKTSICGFGGGIPPLPSTGTWENTKATDNFSPQGCDMVAPYIYAGNSSTGTYDWSMSSILPAFFATLRSQGWESTKEPLVGVPQAFGGQVSGIHWPIPDANAVETQTKTYCQQGAVGIIYYDWDTKVASPMTNAGITQGIRRGLADCQQIWGVSAPASVSSPTLAP